MLKSTSIKTRFLVSIGTNLIRSFIGFISGMLVARGLGPSSYGDLAFLLGSFSAVLSLLDLGASNAFYTFLSQRAQGALFLVSYFCWVVLQFLITLLFVAWIIPDDLFGRIWLGHSREVVLIALLVVFMQQQVWQTVNQVGESLRRTVKVQLLNLCIAITYLIVVVLLTTIAHLSLINIMLLMIVQYAVATYFAYQVLGGRQIASNEKGSTPELKQIFHDYFGFCKPLILLSLVVFFYNFADKWLLQNYGGSIQQGYFQISNQFATISLLATTSMLSVFWKEIAEAWDKNDHIRVERLYRKVSRALVMLGAIISGLLIPWAEQIVAFFLGVAYEKAWPVLALMLFYPIHQSMGQIGGTVLLARGQTKTHMYISVAGMLVSMPVAFFLLAPVAVGGFNMGAWGIALKSVLLGVISVNVQAWIIARYSGWRFDWVYQVIGIPLMILIGYSSKFLVSQLWNLNNVSLQNMFIPVILDLIIYIVLVTYSIRLLPWLVGLEKNDLESMLGSTLVKLKLLLSSPRKL
ncbi:RfbX Membrane protein involved in the export of O-antigen and teichoic acid [Methylophilaceae bacterium]